MEYNKRGYKLKKPKESIPSLFLHDWKFFNGLDEITEGFNTFFCKYWQWVRFHIPNSDTSLSSFLGDPFNINFIFAHMTNQKVYEIQNKLKSKNSSEAEFIGWIVHLSASKTYKNQEYWKY